MTPRYLLVTLAACLIVVEAATVDGQQKPAQRIAIPALVTSIAFAPDGETLLAWDPAGWSRWDVHSGRQRGRDRPIAKICERAAALPRSEDGRVVAVQCRNRLVYFETATARLLGEQQLAEGASAALYTAAADGTATALVMAGATDTVVIRALTGTAATELPIGAEVEQLELSAAGTRLTVGTSPGVQIRELPGGRLLRTVAGTAAHALSGDGRQLAVVSARGVQLFDVESGAMARELEGRVAHLRFSRDGRQLAGWTNQRVTLWDTATGAPRLRLDADEFVGAAISPDGQLLTTVALARRGETTSSLIALWRLPQP